MISRTAAISFVLVVAAAPAARAQDPPVAPLPPLPPIAERRPHDVVSEHGRRSDPYYWLRDDTRSKPDVLGYLAAEQAYYEKRSAEWAELKETLYQESLARLKQDDETVPYKKNDYLYWSRNEAGKQHSILLRRPAAGGEEQLLVDANREAEGKEYYNLGSRAISPHQDLIAFLDDTRGRYQYTLRVREIATGRDLPDRIEGLSSAVAWGADNKTLYYVENDPVTLRTVRVKRHRLGTDPKSDPVIFEEPDTSFYISVDRSSDDRFLMISLESTVSNEVHVLDLADPKETLKILAPRERDFQYSADHIAGRWVVRTDWQAPNFRIMTVPDSEIGDRARWKELVPHDPAVFVGSFLLLRDYLVYNERSEGLLRVRVLPWAAPEKSTLIRYDEPAYAAELGTNAEQDTTKLRYTYESMTTPLTTNELDLATGERTLLKRRTVPGYDPAAYVTERLWAPARDGVKIPVSIVYRKGFVRDGTAPLYQYGSGSYGSSMDPYFDRDVVSLLDRGFVYALAHVRGGQEMGRAWREDGRLAKKTNTFNDFVDVTDFLVRERYAAKDKVVAQGASAGGLLMGAIATFAPDRYRAIVADVPFVDVVTTMLDDTIPLTSNEFDEWGDPRRKADYDWMLAYSPYDNVRAQEYPALLVITGLHDSQVQYFEPAKWVAKLRATKTGSNPILFKVNMAAGHGGRSGRYEAIRETTEALAFLLHELGIEK